MATSSDPRIGQLPRELRLAFSRAVESPLTERHDALFEVAEATLEYLASLSLSDYRSRSPHASSMVESLLDRIRTRNRPLADTLELFYETAGAVDESLFPHDDSLTANRLPHAGRLLAVIERIEAEAAQLAADVAPTEIDVGACVSGALAAPARQVSWWAAWKVICHYHRYLRPPAARGWPWQRHGYYELLTPLLEQALVEVLTYSPIIDTLVTHPVVTLTLMTNNPDGSVTHRICGDRGGDWFEADIVLPGSITERWTSPDWHATPASKFILDVPIAGTRSIRALFWDLHESPPPPKGVPGVASAPVPLATPRKTIEAAASNGLEGRGTALGTCGEFAQGPLPDGSQFHVTCPINKTANVLIELCTAPKYVVTGLLPYQHKLEQALRYTCEHLDLGPVAIRVRHWSDLDIGKGMGSSTADVLSGMRAIANAVGATLSPQVEGKIATRVESSDGTMYPGITVVNQKTGEQLRQWDWFPDFVIVMIVPRNNVLTEDISFDGKEALAPEYECLLAGFDDAVRNRSLDAFAALSTHAASLNAEYLVNPYAEKLASRLDQLGALGLNVGHTGTVCGLLYENTQHGRDMASESCFALRQEYPDVRDVKVVNTPHWTAMLNKEGQSN